MDQKKIGKYIAEKRKLKNLTQAQLADMMGVGYKAVSKWERGLSLPDVSKYQELCSILGITLNELFAGEDLEEESIALKSEQNIIEIASSNDKKRRWTKIVISWLTYIIIVLVLITCINIKAYHSLLVDDYSITAGEFQLAVNKINDGDLSDREILFNLGDYAFKSIRQTRELNDSVFYSSRWYSDNLYNYLFECLAVKELTDEDVSVLIKYVPAISEELNKIDWGELGSSGATLWYRKDIFNVIENVDDIADSALQHELLGGIRE